MRPTKERFRSSYETKPSNLPKKIQIWKKTCAGKVIKISSMKSEIIVGIVGSFA